MNDGSRPPAGPVGCTCPRPARHLLAVALLVLAAGCATEPERDDGDEPQRGAAARDALDDAIASSDARPDDGDGVPAAVSEALAPAEEPLEPLDGGEERFDISVPGMEVREFFMALVEDSDHNMIVHPDVDGTVTLSLRDVTVPQVMEAVRDVYGYEYRKSPAGFLVLPRTPQTRIFQLEYLNIDRSGVSDTRVSSGALTDAENGDGVASGSSIRTDSSSEVWGEVRGAVEAIVGDEEGARVGMSPQAGSLVVRALPGTLRQVEEFLGGVETNLGRQVVLEAQILEVELSDRFQAGVDWQALARPDGREVTMGQTTGLFGDDTPSPGGVFTLSAELGDFSSFVQLLETQGDVQVLSSPRVSTVNNQKAVIKVGTDDFFVTDITTRTPRGAVGATDGTGVTPLLSGVDLTPFFSGIALDVTPHISADDRVTLHVHPTVSEVTDERKDIGTGDGSFSVPLASSEVRESDSIVRARSGEVVVIGGLMQDTTRERTGQTPVLGSLPMVGGLFTQRRSETVKSELVILLRPVVVGEDTWRDELGGARERMDRFEAPPDFPQP